MGRGPLFERETRVFEFPSHVLVTTARKAQMRYAREFITTRAVAGVLIVVPVYLAVLLLLQGMKSVATLVRPVAALVPDGIPAERLVSLLLVLALCFLVGVSVRTRSGCAVREHERKGARAAERSRPSRLT
jgi:hypothetical protein